uniref:Uncharacterized protein n=1 Tax=Trichobilharzia regenti TaxID=157069 RepID=A0AA85IW32_TRIRE|nr:unnamed protein product [Trichobilharzia regenti]
MFSKIWWTLLASIFLYAMFLPQSEAWWLWWLFCLFAPNSTFCDYKKLAEKAFDLASQALGSAESSGGST